VEHHESDVAVSMSPKRSDNFLNRESVFPSAGKTQVNNVCTVAGQHACEVECLSQVTQLEIDRVPRPASSGPVCQKRDLEVKKVIRWSVFIENHVDYTQHFGHSTEGNRQRRDRRTTRSPIPWHNIAMSVQAIYISFDFLIVS